MFDVKGYFNPEEDQYTLLTPKTKAEYKTCLMNAKGYGFAANQFGGGLTQCKCSFGNRNSVVKAGNRTVYFRDDENNDVWCIGGFPVVSQVENYKCTHATAFKVYADCMLGKGDRGFADFKKLLPENPENPGEIADTVPYTVSNACTTVDFYYGKSSARPWSTGTQGWLFRIVIEGFLGLRYAYGGFSLDPAFPSQWDKAQVQLLRGHTCYTFRITNHNTGTKKILVDGKEIRGSFVPFTDKEQLTVDICL